MFVIGTKLREARLSQNLSLRELASRADVSASLLSQIENGKANPSVMSLLGIAAALSVPVHYFFPADGMEESAGADEEIEESSLVAQAFPVLVRPADESRGFGSNGARLNEVVTTRSGRNPVVHAHHRARIELMGGVAWERLTAGAEEGIEFLEIAYEPGGSSGPAMSRHTGREFGVILEGELVLELGFERYPLQVGDSIAFDSAIPHRLSNPGQGVMRAVWVNIDH